MLAPRTTLGKYTIDGLLGGGGFGLVYRATQRGPAGFSQAVALKILRPGARQRSGLVALAREARIVARLRHRNIVQIYDFAHQGQLHFLVMELVEGLTLRQLRRRAKRLPLWLQIGIGAEIASGLRFAHEARDEEQRPLGLIHRDIKPSNILVSRTGDVKLADFGLAKLSLVPSAERTAAGVVKGTPAYMSPEQHAGRPATPASDVFSLATVLYELCTGVNPAPLLSQARAPKFAPSIVGQAPADADAATLRQLDVLLGAALTVDATRRPSAAAVGDELRRILAALAPASNPARLNHELAAHVELALRDDRAPAVERGSTPGTLSADDVRWGGAAVVVDEDAPDAVDDDNVDLDELIDEAELASAADDWSIDEELRRTNPAAVVEPAETRRTVDRGPAADPLEQRRTLDRAPEDLLERRRTLDRAPPEDPLERRRTFDLAPPEDPLERRRTFDLAPPEDPLERRRTFDLAPSSSSGGASRPTATAAPRAALVQRVGLITAAALGIGGAILVVVLLLVPARPIELAHAGRDAATGGLVGERAPATIPDARAAVPPPAPDRGAAPDRESHATDLPRHAGAGDRHAPHATWSRRHNRKPAAKREPAGGPAVAPDHATAAWGWLSVNSEPWTHVHVDGRRVATTPVFRHALRAGAHVVRLVTAAGRSTTRSVIIARERHLNLGMITLSADR